MTRKKLLYFCRDHSGLGDVLRSQLGDWDIHQVSTTVEAGRALQSGAYTVGLIDYERDMHKLVDIDAFLRRHGDLQWIGVLAPTDLDFMPCRDLVLEHLYDYHTTPADPVRLAHALGHAHGWGQLRHRQKQSSRSRGLDSPLVGNGDAMQRLRVHVERVAKVAAPALIWGESGTGKELTAQAIHAASNRAKGPFVPINCGAISPTLLHSELFGYERGAFTGATTGKAGLIESANGGTLFLDEIGDLPKEMQASLLRFLQEKTITRLGSTRQVNVDVRVIAASHVQLFDAVQRGDFREDLYYRLAVLPVTVPALRERREDLVTLAQHFFDMYSDEKAARLTGFSDRALAAILDHDWPGNVRELINCVRRAMVMADGRLITPADLGLAPSAAAAPAALDDRRMRSERTALRACLDRSGQNVSRAARDLGVSRTTMYRLLEKHGMRASLN